MVEIEIESALHVVATPIGCLQDISARALAILAGVDWIAAEDTRQTSKLLQHYGIRRPMVALHAHNETKQSEGLVAKLLDGERGALVSDAGTPLVSDPGAVLVSACHDAGVRVVPVPGACAGIAALSAAGFGGGGFMFHGFLPPKQAARQEALRTVAGKTCPVVFYEAPHRIEAMLADVVAVLGGGRELLIAREITKKFETIVRGRADAIVELVKEDDNMRRGEFVVVLQGLFEHEPDVEAGKRVWRVVAPYLSHKDAVQVTAELSGLSKKIIYPWGIE